MKETFFKFHSDMSQFSEEKPVVVTYDESTHILTYRQLDNTISIPYMRPYYLQKKNFKLGILNQQGLLDLINKLKILIDDRELDKEGGTIMYQIDKLCLKVFKTYYNPKLNTVINIPQNYLDIKFVSITNPFFVWLIMKYQSYELKSMYKSIKNHEKIKHKTSSNENEKEYIDQNKDEKNK